MRLRGPVDLPATLQGGQAFRWSREGAAFVGVVGDALVTLAPAGGDVEARATPRRPRAFFERYLRLETGDDARRARLARDPVLAPVLAAHPGLRLLRQDPWETTAAFITSANNNVLRIEGSLRAIAERWGAPIDGAPDARAFPDAATLARATERQLRACGLGYRAPFLRESARMVARGDVALHALRGAPLDDIRAALLELPGVGPKVADCIALFSLDADGAFPIDRWVLRAMEATFGRAFSAKDAAAFAHARWGEDAGLAQQLLFHAVRTRAAAPGTKRLAGRGSWVKGKG